MDRSIVNPRSRLPVPKRTAAACRPEDAACLPARLSSRCDELSALRAGRWNLGVIVEEFAHFLGGDVKRGVGGRHARIHRKLKEHFLDVARFELARETGSEVQPEFFPAAERGGGREHEQPPRAMAQPGPGPDRAPRESRDQILE